MFDELVLKNVKGATVALGLVEKGSAKPLKICGSGFLIDPNGHIITQVMFQTQSEDGSITTKSKRLNSSGLPLC